MDNTQRREHYVHTSPDQEWKFKLTVHLQKTCSDPSCYTRRLARDRFLSETDIYVTAKCYSRFKGVSDDLIMFSIPREHKEFIYFPPRFESNPGAFEQQFDNVDHYAKSFITRKICERRKPRKSVTPWEAESSYPLRENIWDYLNDRSNRFDDTRRTHVKKSKQKSTNNGNWRTVKVVVCLLTIFGLSVPFWIPGGVPRIELLKNVLPEVKLLSFLHFPSTSVTEECCYKLKHLTLTVSRIEQELRNMLRLRKKFMLSLPNTRTTPLSKHPSIFPTASVIYGAKAVKGSGTEEWGTQVALWGVVPLWRAAAPPDIILALRRPKPSECWPFGGSYGEVIIELPRKMFVSALSLEHIRPDTAKSAPRDFVVYTIQENGTYIKAADGKYSYKKPAKQYYFLNTENAVTKSIVFRVLSNQGNPKYTCIYRVQVYGNAENTFEL